MSLEIWKSIPDLEGFYSASSLGRIRSESRYVNNPHGTKSLRRSRIRVLTPDSDGYLTVNTSIGGTHKTRRVHDLVCLAFHGLRPDGMIVLHGARGKLDNTPSNLSWGTPSDNIGRDRLRDGTDNRGVKHSLAKLTERNVHEIRRMIARGGSLRSIAAKFGVTSGAINGIKKGKNWAWLKPEMERTSNETNE